MKISQERSVNLLTRVHSKRDELSFEELVMSEIPDIIVINLDQEDEFNFGASILAVQSVPTPMLPIIVGTTQHEGYNFRKKAYDAGIDDYMLRPFSAHDLWLRLDVHLRTRKLQKQLDEVSRKLSVLNVKLADSNRRLEEMTLTDELTGLYNMRFMVQFLEKQFELLTRYERPFSIMMIDLDHFKDVNDQNDHLVGSASIKTIGGVINETTRRSDVKARYGGDEYIVAMPETDRTNGQLAGERLRSAISQAELKNSQGELFKITGSIGVATFDRSRHKNFTDLVKDADRAMYLAKERGRNQVVMYDQDSSGYDEKQSAVLTEIKKAAKGGSFKG